jgi:hypothetical protein
MLFVKVRRVERQHHSQHLWVAKAQCNRSGTRRLGGSHLARFDQYLYAGQLTVRSSLLDDYINLLGYF